LRRAPVRRFPLGVFYFFNEKEILVVAVAHASWRARVWRSRH
jgi:hypothetical protein